MLAVAERAPVLERFLAPPTVHIGSLENPSDIQFAVEHIRDGGIVAAQVHGVFGMWGDGRQDRALDAMITAKGEPNQSRPFSNMRFSQDVWELVDFEAMHPAIRSIIETERSDHLGTILGTLIHLRLPLKEDKVHLIPLRLRSKVGDTWVFHNLDPQGHPISHLIDGLKNTGVTDVGLTTLNVHDVEPEISHLGRAREFCENLSEVSIPLILTDPSYTEEAVKGSMVIVDTLTAQIKRKGFVPTSLVRYLLGVDLVENDQTLDAKYPQAHAFQTLLEHARRYGFSPALTAVLARRVIAGHDLQGVIQELQQST